MMNGIQAIRKRLEQGEKEHFAFAVDSFTVRDLIKHIDDQQKEIERLEWRQQKLIEGLEKYKIEFWSTFSCFGQTYHACKHGPVWAETELRALADGDGEA